MTIRPWCPFVPVDPEGVMSIVIHATPLTQRLARPVPRQACFPLVCLSGLPAT